MSLDREAAERARVASAGSVKGISAREEISTGIPVPTGALLNGEHQYTSELVFAFMAHLGLVSGVGFVGLLLTYIERLCPRFGWRPKPTGTRPRVQSLESSRRDEISEITAKHSIRQWRHNYKILCIGRDLAPLQVRSAELASAGHQVKVVTPYWALILLRNDYYDAVILCHTLAKWESRLLRFQIESLGRKTPVFQLCSSVQGPAVQHGDSCVNSEDMLSAVISALEHKSDAAAA